ncbi:S8 family peptidase [Sphingobacterium haloxyli]|nr:S8 family serine peptidase [Sphingobacterium haloxyli]
MKTLYVAVFFLAGMLTFSYAQDDFYYYHGEKKAIKLHPTLRYIALEDSIQHMKTLLDMGAQIHERGVYTTQEKERYWVIVDIVKENIKNIQQLTTLPNISYIGPVVGVNDTSYVAISQFFHIEVTLESQLNQVIELAKKNGADYVGAIPYTNGWHTFESKGSKSSLAIANQLFETEKIKEISPDFMFDFAPFLNKMKDKRFFGNGTQTCTNDPQFPQQWGLQNSNGIDVKACTAWGITKGSLSTTVAVLDTGIDPTLTEFATNLSSTSFDAQSGTSPAVVYPSDHGTHVAGIIGANQNAFLISGIAPSVELMAVSHSLAVIPNISAQLASGLNWAWQNGADVINNSWGDQGGAFYGNLQSAVLESAINSAQNSGRGGLGTIVVFASGNYAPVMDYPATYSPNSLTVGSITSSGSRSSSSGYGAALDVVAPGSNILSTTFSNTTTYKSGTSMAAPFTSGLAGLILSIQPTLTRLQVNNFIESTAQKVGGYSYTATAGRPNGTWNNQMGYGLINAHAALVAAGGGGTCTPSTPPTVINGTNYTSNTALNGCNFEFTNSNVTNNASLTVNANGYVLLASDFSVVAGSSLTVQ